MLDGQSSDPEAEKADLEGYLKSKITIEGCSIEITDAEVIISTPPITQNTNLIQLEDNADVNELSNKIAGRRISVETPSVGQDVRFSVIGITHYRA